MTKSPAFQFYPAEFLTGRVATYSMEEIGAYTLLLAYDWSLNGLPNDVEKLAKLCRINARKFRALWATISEQFEEVDGKLYNPRLAKEREKQELWRAKSAAGGRKSAEMRAKGGSRVVEPPSEPNGQPKGNSSSSSSITTTTSSAPRRGTKASGKRGDGFDLGPYLDLHREFFPGSTPPLGRYGAAFKKLEAEHGRAETLVRWRRCLERDAKYATPERLGTYWSEYANVNPPIVDEWGCLTEYGERVTRPAFGLRTVS